ncbi:MAG: hypothetical protein O3A34_01595 [Actinomycetota bacterium]|nr:hypothetical protein [Actinomycetota bacterium]
MLKPRLLWVGYTGSEGSSHFEVVQKLKKAELVDFFVATGVTNKSDKWKLVDEPVVSHSDALFAKYESFISDSKFLMDQEIYLLCASFEGETLRMMDRLHRRGPTLIFNDSFDTRRKMFLSHCSFWYQYLLEKKISHVMFFAVPHEVYTFVIYSLAKKLNLKIIIFSPEKSGPFRNKKILEVGKRGFTSMMDSTFFVAEDIEDIGKWRLSTSLNLIAKELGINLSRSTELFNRNAIYQVAQPSVGNSSVYRKSVKKMYKRVLRIISDYKKSIETLSYWVKSRLRYREHLSLAKSSDSASKSVLFCLAYQPEESTSPRGGIFVEQLLAIELLSVGLPEGWKLRVREHPDQYSRLRARPKNFLKDISEIQNVEIVPPGETVLESFNASSAVAITSGTMGVEAWVAGIPTIVFGEIWIKNAPGAYYVRSLNDVREALLRISEGVQSSEHTIEGFLTWTESHAFSGRIKRIDSHEAELREVTVENIFNILRVWFVA